MIEPRLVVVPSLVSQFLEGRRPDVQEDKMTERVTHLVASDILGIMVLTGLDGHGRDEVIVDTVFTGMMKIKILNIATEVFGSLTSHDIPAERVLFLYRLLYCIAHDSIHFPLAPSHMTKGKKRFVFQSVA
jgi:hypothetical protein